MFQKKKKTKEKPERVLVKRALVVLNVSLFLMAEYRPLYILNLRDLYMAVFTL